MARELSKENIKLIIGILRERRASWSELKKESGLSSTTLNRILEEYLSYWGLIAKDKAGKWAWFLTTRTYETRADYEVALGHSKELVKGFNWLGAFLASLPSWKPERSGLDEQELNILGECARAHIRTGYEELNGEINEYENAMRLKKPLLSELRKQDQRFDESFLLNVDLYLNARSALKKDKLKDVENLIKVWGLKKVSSLNELHRQTQHGYVSINRQFLDLITDFNSGTPFEGHCRKCPRIKVRTN